MNFNDKQNVARELGFWKTTNPATIVPDIDMLAIAVQSVRAGKFSTVVNPMTFQAAVKIEGLSGYHTREVLEDLQDYIKFLDTNTQVAYDRAMKGII
jgi:hypothetical protein